MAVITLIGSGRFQDEFEKVFTKLTLSGHIVFRPAIFTVTKFCGGRNLTEFEHGTLDVVHAKKIEMSDYVLIIDPNNYIGNDTKEEIKKAKNCDVPVKSFYNDFHGIVDNLVFNDEKIMKARSDTSTLKEQLKTCSEALEKCQQTVKELQVLSEIQ